MLILVLTRRCIDTRREGKVPAQVQIVYIVTLFQLFDLIPMYQKMLDVVFLI